VSSLLSASYCILMLTRSSPVLDAPTEANSLSLSMSSLVICSELVRGDIGMV
jgi:hypothetical protein